MFKVVKGHGSIRKFRTGAVVAVLALSFSGVMVSAEETVTNANADTVATEVSSDVAEAQSESSAVAERSPISEEPNTEIPQSQGIIHVTPNGDGTYSSTEPFYVGEDVPQSQGIIHVTPNGDGTYSSTEPYLVEEPASEQVANAKENVDEAQDAVNKQEEVVANAAEVVQNKQDEVNAIASEQVANAKENVDEAQDAVNKQEEVVANAAEVVQNKQDEVNAINSASPSTNVTQNQLNTAKDDVTNMQNQVADATSKHEEALSNQNASSIKVDETKQDASIAQAQEQQAKQALDDATKKQEELIKQADDLLKKLGSNAPQTASSAEYQLSTAESEAAVKRDAVKYAKEELEKAKALQVDKAELARLEKALEDAIKQAQPLEMVSHRGYNREYPESSYASYVGAYADGFRSYEADIRFTKDGIPVVHHDATINAVARNKDGSSIIGNKFIRDLTLAELNAYDYGISRGAGFIGTKIQTLDELLTFFASKEDNVRMQLELKENNTDAEKQVMYDMAKELNVLNKIQWIAFDWNKLDWFVNKDPQASVALLAGNDSPALMAKAKSFQNGQRNVSVSINFPNLTQEQISAYVKEDIPVYIWTTDHESTVTRFANTGITGVVTNSGTRLFNVLVTAEEQKQITDLKNAIASLKAKIAVNPAKDVKSAEADLKAKEVEIAVLTNRISDLKNAITVLTAKENADKAVSRLNQDYSSKKNTLSNTLARLDVLETDYQLVTKKVEIAETNLKTRKKSLEQVQRNYDMLVSIYNNQKLSEQERKVKLVVAEQALEDAKVAYQEALSTLDNLKETLVAKENLYKKLLSLAEAKPVEEPKAEAKPVEEPKADKADQSNEKGSVDTLDLKEAKGFDNSIAVNVIDEAQVETPVATPVANSVLVGNTNNDTQLPKTSSDAGLLMTAVGWLSLAGITLTRKRKSSTTSTDS